MQAVYYDGLTQSYKSPRILYHCEQPVAGLADYAEMHLVLPT
jgi:hypothetical protein